jgi:uncharacterized protein YkwD
VEDIGSFEALEADDDEEGEEADDEEDLSDSFRALEADEDENEEDEEDTEADDTFHVLESDVSEEDVEAVAKENNDIKFRVLQDDEEEDEDEGQEEGDAIKFRVLEDDEDEEADEDDEEDAFKVLQSGDDDDEEEYEEDEDANDQFRVLQAIPTTHGGIQKVDPSATAPPQLPASFSSFDNAKPQNEGNCLDAINKVRTAARLLPLQNNATLVALSAKHSAYMAAAQVVSHDGFWSYRFDAVPATFGGVGEVVVSDDLLNAPNGSAKRAVERWMDTPEHNALLMRSDMLWMGCSTADGADGRFYVTAMVVSK